MDRALPEPEVDSEVEMRHRMESCAMLSEEEVEEEEEQEEAGLSPPETTRAAGAQSPDWM